MFVNTHKTKERMCFASILKLLFLYKFYCIIKELKKD